MCLGGFHYAAVAIKFYMLTQFRYFNHYLNKPDATNTATGGIILNYMLMTVYNYTNNTQ